MDIIALNSCSHAGEMRSGVKRQTAIESLKVVSAQEIVTFSLHSF